MRLLLIFLLIVFLTGCGQKNLQEIESTASFAITQSRKRKNWP
jgi:hypothetical protein